MEYLTPAFGVVACIALFFAWRGARRAKYLQQRLDTATDRYFTLANQLRELEETSQRELMDLKVELKRRAGLLKFEPQMTIGEIMEMHPRAVEVLAGYHLGGCSSCAVSPAQTLSAAAQQHNINLDMLMGALKQLENGNGNSSAPKYQPDRDLRIIA